MGYLLDAIKALGTTLKNAFRKPTTVEFPKVVRPRAERYRASFALPDDENGEIACVACLACERICPSQIIKMKSGGKRESPVTGKKRAYVDEFTLDLTACIQCELCVQVCNSDAIYMVREPELPAYSREDLVLDIAKLRENAKTKTAAWGRGTILQEAQEGKPKAEKKAPAAEAKPAPAKPAAEKPAEAKPAAEKPAEAKPAEKPAEAKPAAEKPAEAKPAEKPADEAPPKAAEKAAEETPAKEPPKAAAEPADKTAEAKADADAPKEGKKVSDKPSTPDLVKADVSPPVPGGSA